MSAELPDIVSRYFEHDHDRDIDSIVSLFSEDAVVVDEGEERHGTAEIRAWQTGSLEIHLRDRDHRDGDTRP